NVQRGIAAITGHFRQLLHLKFRILHFTFFYPFSSSKTEASATTPSSRPTNPSFSVVVALMDTSAVVKCRIRAITSCICGTYGFILGACRQRELSTFTTW